MHIIMTRLLQSLVASCALLSIAHADNPNGGLGTPGFDPPLIVDADWYATGDDTPPAFYWGNGIGAPNVEGPYTFNALTNVRLDVTDDFNVGDRFEVFDFGNSLGLTSIPAGGSGGGEVGPEAAFNDPDYSSGSFYLAPGAHSITINAIVNDFAGGRGYLRAMTAVPEPSTFALAGIGAFALVAAARRRSAR